jgi:16S rRNA (cytidine1402-2'-O)-methyltransferase
MSQPAAGTLYIVPTPIGNLGDLSPRAQQILADVAAIAAEDTRHSRKLLQQFAINNEVFALHEHNERERAQAVIERLQSGDSLALISDAGTPLISDPGYVLVQQCRAQGIKVVALPGPCAITTALSGAGLPTDRFSFEGFLPAKSAQRRNVLSELLDEPRTMVFYESPHRILASLADFVEVFGTERMLVLARELTKQFETYLTGTIAEVLAQVTSDSNQQRGEFVLMLAGAPANDQPVETQTALRTVLLLREHMPLKKAAACAAEIHGLRKNQLYQLALEHDNT